MRLTVMIVLILGFAATAQDAKQDMKKARELERRAEVLLDQGNNGAAFELLAQAAELRARAKGDQPKAAKKSKKPKKAKATKGKGKGPAAESAAALRRWDEAAKGGDMAGVRRAAAQTRGVLIRWQKDLAEREARMKQRVAALERQLVEVQKLLR